MLRRRAARLSTSNFIGLADWVLMKRKDERLTQKEFAARHMIPVRQVKTYEAVAKWPDEAKQIVRQSSSFLVTDLTREFANRSWKSQAALTDALRLWASKRRRLPGAVDPNIAYLEDDLETLFAAPVKVSGDGCSGELRISFRSPDDLERILTRVHGYLGESPTKM